MDLPPLHRQLSFNSPLSESRALQLVAFLGARAQGTVVDIGCGWGHLLRMLVSRHEAVRGIGIDLRLDAITFAQASAAESQLTDRLSFICGDVKQHLPALAHGAICIGASQAWRSSDAVEGPLDCAAALAGLRKLVAKGAPVVYGDAIWTRTPTPAAIAPLGGRSDEFISMPEMIDLAWRCGFAVAGSHEASLDEWDDFESAHVARYSNWLADHPPDHPDSAEVTSLALKQTRAYHQGYRGVLGMAYLRLLAV